MKPLYFNQEREEGPQQRPGKRSRGFSLFILSLFFFSEIYTREIRVDKRREDFFILEDWRLLVKSKFWNIRMV